MPFLKQNRKLGIALGGGAARGWAHIGVLSALAEHDIEPDIVCGTSIGALVGGLYVAGRLEDLETWVGRLSPFDVLSYVDVTVAGGGAIRGDRLMEYYQKHVGEHDIAALAKPFAAVATDLDNGTEVWLRQGPLLGAIRASISFPGLFTPVELDGRLLADGGLVNPVPVNVCRALGADIVIAVDVNSNRLRRTRREPKNLHPDALESDMPWLSRIEKYLSWIPETKDSEAARPDEPTFIQVLTASLGIMQDRISLSRLAGDPPDILISPRVGHVDMLDFASGRSTVQEGYESVRRMLPALYGLLDISPE
ncbi:MAG: patatin-like phospholipase family protein [Rhodothermales bacterium]